MEHAVQSTPERSARTPVARPATVRLDRSRAGAAISSVGQLVREGPAATEKRHALQRMFGDAARLPGDQAAAASPRQMDGPASGHAASDLPQGLRVGLEALSGLSMEGVRVSYNSPRPAQLNALAFAQGRDIHLGPGQEKHLAHEAWHVVQQAQGRVRPTRQLRAGAAINDDAGLEREADVMGARALTHGPGQELSPRAPQATAPSAAAPAQCYGAIRFANLDASKPAYVTKANDIIAALRAAPSINQFLANKNTLVTLEFDAQLASVRVVHDQVQISLSPWFFEQESRGRIVGMLAHEFGVHPLATAAMTGQERTQEDQDHTANTPMNTGVANHQITPQQAGQRDHAFAAVSGQPRYREYRKTAYEVCLGLLNLSRQANATVTQAHVTDAIMTYLSDIAMILATNDHRGKIVVQPQRTADCFNLERTSWLQYLPTHAGAIQQDTNDLTNLTPAQKSKGDVLGEVASLMGGFSLSMFTSSTSSANLTQAGPNGPLEITPIQQQVLNEFGPQLRPKGGIANPSLFDAIDGAWQPPGARTRALNRLTQRLQAIQANSAEHGVLQPAQALINSSTMNAAVSDATLNAISWSLTATLRVIQPSGKILFRSYGGPTVTLLRVDKPASHYRFAT